MVLSCNRQIDVSGAYVVLTDAKPVGVRLPSGEVLHYGLDEVADLIAILAQTLEDFLPDKS